MSVRIYKLAEELGIKCKQLLEKLQELNIDVKSHVSTIDDETYRIVLEELKEDESIEQLRKEKEEEEANPILEVDLPITVKELAKKLSIKPSEFIQRLMRKKIMVNINQALNKEVLQQIGEEVGYDIIETPSTEEKVIGMHEEEEPQKQEPRAPVVTLMGHVDHGKTSLLELIRKTTLTSKESGGITQHIGAYQIAFEGSKITFLDTPGHEAFTTLRSRGAHVTDLVILVIAADDGVMPQTKEAIDHARAAGVPIVVAINKIDKPNADTDRVKQELTSYDLAPEGWGGKTITVETSAETEEGIERLLEMLLLESEMLQLQANPDKLAKGVIIEAELSKGKGPVATALVQSGTLKVTDVMMAGKYYGRIRALINDRGENVDQAVPSTPVGVLGLSGVPEAGEQFYVVKDEETAIEVACNRQEEKREKSIPGIKRVSLEDLYEKFEEGEVHQLNLIIKADVKGSLEALVQAVNKIETEEVNINLLHKGVGIIKESDIMLAAASDAIIFGFHIGANSAAEECAKREGVQIMEYDVIYEAVQDIKASIEGMLEPEEKEVELGKAEVREVFDISKVGKIAGCYITEGKIDRGALCKVKRDNEIIYESRINSLKRFKKDVSEVNKNYECGMNVEGFDDFKKGDVIEIYKIKKIPKRLE